MTPRSERVSLGETLSRCMMVFFLPLPGPGPGADAFSFPSAFSSSRSSPARRWVVLTADSAQVSWVLCKDKVEVGNSPLRMFRLMVLVVREILFPILDFISCFPSHAGVAPIWPFENRQFNWGRLWSFSCKVHWRRPETITRLSQTEDS